MRRIYLDNNASTGLDPKVLEAMLLDLGPYSANPSSTHLFGREAKQLLISSRQRIATFFDVKPSELIFTSGGTESINMLIRGLFDGGHILSSNIEHAASFQTLQEFDNVTYLPAGLQGAVTAEQITAAICPETRLIVLNAVNNETGIKIDIAKIAKIAKEARIPLIVDGVAWLGKELFTIPEGVSGMAFSGHKIHGPKGIGLAFLRSPLTLSPLLLGGKQEMGRRAGTENLAGILGLAKAIELLKIELPAATKRMEKLRDLLITGLQKNIENIVIHGEGDRIANCVNISFPNISGEDLLIRLDLMGIAVSHGSACNSGALEPSRVLLNMGISQKIARSAIRFSLSRWTTEEEILYTVETFKSLFSTFSSPSCV